MKRLLSQMMVMVLLFTVVGCATTPHQRQQAEAQERWSRVRGRVKYQLARQQYEGGLTRQCATTLSEAIALNPKDVNAYVLLAKVHLEDGKLATAWHTLELARSLQAQSPDLTYLEGVILEQRGTYEAALGKFRQALEMNPVKIEYLTATAETLVVLDRLDEAQTLVAEYADKADDRASVSVLAGRIALLRGAGAEAAARFGDALVAAGDDPVIAEELGLLLADMKRYEEALALLTPLLNNPDEDAARGAVSCAVARCHLGLDDPSSAQAVLMPYVAEHADDAVAQLLLAKAAIAAGDVWSAVSAIEQARKHDPSHPEVAFVGAVIDRQRGRLDAAENEIRKLIELTPDDADAHCLLGEILISRGQSEAAQRQFETALSIDADCTWASSRLSRLVLASPADRYDRNAIHPSSPTPSEPSLMAR